VGVGVRVARVVAVLDGVTFGVPDTEGVPVIVELDVIVLVAVWLGLVVTKAVTEAVQEEVGVTVFDAV
jgi:hypothetical protein